MKTYKGIITELPKNGIFVFGSNTQGRHGAGAALTAIKKFGAVYGQASGLQGRSHAIITKDLTKSIHPSIPVGFIKIQIANLYALATLHPMLDFYIAYQGNSTNLNGYTPEKMAHMFNLPPIPENIVFEEEFAKLIQDDNTKRS